MSAPETLQQAMLATLFDAEQPLTAAQLANALLCTRRDLLTAVRDQANLGNIRRGEPVQLTASARSAIAAGRRPSNDWRAFG